jgi:hypothetical protein
LKTISPAELPQSRESALTELKRIDTGVRAGHVLTMHVELSGARYEKPRDRVHFFSQVETRLARLPGVVSVGATDRLPVSPPE